METENRLQLLDHSQKSRNKKLLEVVGKRDLFIEKINTIAKQFEQPKSFQVVFSNPDRVLKKRVSGFDSKKPGYPGSGSGFQKYKI